MELQKISIIIFVLIRASYAASSTELVEETGCYNSEFKLTCNHIDSTIGILEATFRPDCETGHGKSNKLCVILTQHYEDSQNSIMKIIAQSLGNRLRMDEEQAVRDFLEALRQARLKEQDQEDKEVRTSEYRTEINSTDEAGSTYNDTEAAGLLVDYIASDRNDKKILRDSLEKLTNFYLTRLIEDSDYYSLEDSDEDKESNIRSRRDLRTVTRKINRRKKLIPGSCRNMNRRIGVLRQLEIQKSLKNYSNAELNIRKALNYRCSGKNHCSFIFENDHPYATFWERGTINIKYICMDAFRVNKYCGELLHIGNEVWESEPSRHPESHEDEEVEEFPKAEARRQSEENVHQITNLKILSKSDTVNKNDSKMVLRKVELDGETSIAKVKMLNFSEKSKPKKENVKLTKNGPKNGVFSQDFNLLKILTNDVAAPSSSSTAEKNENKIYKFKKPKETMKVPIQENVETNEIEVVMPTDGIDLPKQASPTYTSSSEYIDYSVENITKPDDFTDESANELSHYSDISRSTAAAMISGTTNDVEIMIVEREDLGKTMLSNPSTAIYGNDLTEDVTETFSTSIDVEIFNETNSLHPQKSEKEVMPSSYEEDYSSETVTVKSSRYGYAYKQKTLPTSTLLHGFISNPGYPSFYIGKSNECKWKLKIFESQTIALTILDLHLRIDVSENCKDSLEIVDDLNSKILYRGCAELSRPLQVKSISNSVEITLKTQSKTIYPKRGFLIHYQAVGCVLPLLQSHVELEYQSEDIVKYVCIENHVFPDTSLPQRVLQCISDSWNDTLVNCVQQETIGSSGPVHLLYNARLRKEKTMGSSDQNFDDVILPLMIVIGLFLINAIVFILIVRYRKRQRQHSLDRELADL